MTHVTCRLTAKNRDQLRNPTLGNRVWATFYRLHRQHRPPIVSLPLPPHNETRQEGVNHPYRDNALSRISLFVRNLLLIRLLYIMLRITAC